jgi:hypothetical protein
MNFGFDMNPRQAMRAMKNPENIAEMLTEEHPETGDSPAQIFADVLTVMRADTARLAEEHGVDVDVQRMSEDRAAELLAGTLSGDGVDLIRVFNNVAEDRDRILANTLSEQEYEQFMAQKTAAMLTSDPGEFD